MKVKELKQILENLKDNLNIYFADFNYGEWDILRKEDLCFAEEQPKWEVDLMVIDEVAKT